MKSRRRRPWSRGTDPPFMTTGRISASQASRLASPAVIRSPVLSNVAEPTVRSRAGRRPRQPQERPPLRPDSPDGRARRDRTRGPARPTGRRPPRAGHCPDRAAAGRSHARSPGPARATTRPPATAWATRGCPSSWTANRTSSRAERAPWEFHLPALGLSQERQPACLLPCRAQLRTIELGEQSLVGQSPGLQDVIFTGERKERIQQQDRIIRARVDHSGDTAGLEPQIRSCVPL